MQMDRKGAGPPRADKPRIEARAFGKATVSIDGRLVAKSEWDSANAKELFFYLLANPQGLSKEQILSALWADVSPAKANGIFHSTAYRMRRAILPECLVFENGLYRINPELNLWYDVGKFVELTSEAGFSNTRERSAQRWREASALYRGDYFEDSYSDWCVPIRMELQNEYLRILASLADLYDQETKTAEAIALYQRILAKDSLREETYRAVMHLQIKSGDRGGALKTYQRCVQTLRDEMGVEPDVATLRLFEQISKTQDI
jgi:two-component SAPR family response regulator